MIKSRLGKVLVGVLTLLPIGHLIFFIWFVFSSVGAQPQSLGEQQFHLLLKLQLGVMLLMLGLLASTSRISSVRTRLQMTKRLYGASFYSSATCSP